MLQIIRKTSEGFHILQEIQDNAWIHAVDPTPSEIERLKNDLHLPPDLIAPTLDPDERARTEKEDGMTLIVLRIPCYNGDQSELPYSTVPLGIILTASNIITICKHDTPILREFIEHGHRRGFSTAKRNRFVLLILLRTANEYLSCLRAIDSSVDVLEARLQVSQRNKELLEILRYQKSLVYFTTALKSNELMMERLQRGRLFHMYPDDEELLEDVLIEIRQAIEMVNISNNILSSMMDAFASIISNNLNIVMKVLALATIILSLPTLVASFFGMNVDLPFQNHPQAFELTLAIALFMSFSVLLIFWKRNWL